MAPSPTLRRIRRGLSLAFVMALAAIGSGGTWVLLGGAEGTALRESSPANGEADVAVTRESALTFTGAVDPATVEQAIKATFSGQPLAARYEVSPDGAVAKLFYQRYLPASSRIILTVDGDVLRDLKGKPVDANADGVAGGKAEIVFDTVSLTPVPGTVVFGRVFGSRQVQVDGATTTVNEPLEGARIRVDGAEDTLSAVTDAQGNFRLENCPGSPFFVHIDGRTVTSAMIGGNTVTTRFPDGPYFPYVGKLWEPKPGGEAAIPNVYLPLVEAGTLQVISTTQPTEVTFPPAVLQGNPAQEGVHITVPPAALYSDDGQRGGRVGIAPVAPDRLPEPLPQGLNLPLVITVQTDGPSNFSQPVPATFPNVPDPKTGLRLPAKSKSALWSFNHDTGHFEVVGPMTVSDDGEYITTDPGVGIPQPGWHGSAPGTQGDGGRRNNRGCAVAIVAPGEANAYEPVVLQVSGAAPGDRITWETGGDPPRGTGPAFSTTYSAVGDQAITVNYWDAQDNHCLLSTVINIKDPFTINAPTEANVRDSATISVTGGAPGATYYWEATNMTPTGATDRAEFPVTFDEIGRASVRLIYGAPGRAPQTYTRDITVKNWLKLRNGVDGPEIPDGFEVKFDTSLWLSIEVGKISGSGILQWQMNPADTIPSSDVSTGGRYAKTVRFPVDGTKTMFISYGSDTAPQYGATLTRSFVVKKECLVNMELEAPNLCQIYQPGQSLTFKAAGTPEGGTMTWTAIGGSPPTGTGSEFTTTYNERGAFPVSAKYEAPNGGECADTHVFGVVIGEPECRIGFSIPQRVVQLEVAGASVLLDPVPGQAGRMEYRVVGPVTVSGDGPILGGATSFPITLYLDQPGDYHIEVTYEYVSPNLPGVPATCIRGTCSASSQPFTVLPMKSVDGSTDGKAESRKTTAEPTLYYAIQDIASGEIVQRGSGGRGGVVHSRPVILAGSRDYLQYVLAGDTLDAGVTLFSTPGEGRRYHFPDTNLSPESSDSDGDGLGIVGERAVGTSPTNPDTDGDGIQDGAEVRQGLNPLDNLPSTTGLIAAVDTAGDAVDLVAFNNLVAVADRSTGVQIFNAFSGLTPMLIGDVAVEGGATRVAMTDHYVASVNSTNRLSVIDITDPPRAFLAKRITLPAPSIVVVSGPGDSVYTALTDSRILRLDLKTGTTLSSTYATFTPKDLAVAGDYLYVLDYYGVSSYRITPVQLLYAGSAQVAANSSHRIFAGQGIAYAVSIEGYSTIDLSDPAHPATIAVGTSVARGWRGLAANGSGLAVAITGANSTDDSPHQVSLLDVHDPTITDRYLATYPEPTTASGISLYNGLAYVANGPNGLAVVNYRAFDTAGVAPSVTLSTNAFGALVEEGKPLRLTASVTDDVQVRNVEFYVDGTRVATDGNYPFEYRTLVPRLADASSIKVQARAYDTGGNNSWSAELSYAISQDATPPVVTGSVPESGGEQSEGVLQAIVAYWSEPIDRDTVTASNFRLYAAGPDNEPGTLDDVPVDGGVVSYRPELDASFLTFPAPLPRGKYRAVVSQPVRDLAGLEMQAAYDWEFLYGDYRKPTVSGTEPAPAAPVTAEAPLSALKITFSEAIDPATLVPGSITLLDLGADLRVGTADDSSVAGTISWDGVNLAAVYTLASPRTSGRFQATVTGTVADIAGNTLENPPYVWSFGDGSFGPLTVVADSLIGPHSPSDWGEYVDRGSLGRIAFTFSENVAADTVRADSAVVVQLPGGNDRKLRKDIAVSCQASLTSARELTVKFPTPITNGEFLLQFSPNLTDVSGNPVDASYRLKMWLGDTEPPYSYSTYPRYLSRGDEGNAIAVTFNEDIAPATLGAEPLKVDEVGGQTFYSPELKRVIMRLAQPMTAGSHRASLGNPRGATQTIADTVGNLLTNPTDWDIERRAAVAADHLGIPIVGVDTAGNAGICVAANGDLNGDGLTDLVISAPYAHPENGAPTALGMVYILFGRANGLDQEMSLADADASFVGWLAGDTAGRELLVPGDLNHDGFDDLLVLTNLFNGSAIHVILGKASGWARDVSLENADAHIAVTSQAGVTLGSLGDVNGDGFADFAATERSAQTGPEAGSLGQAWLFFGSATLWPAGANLQAATVNLYGRSAGEASLQTLAGVGDVDGDGFDDIAIGLPYATVGDRTDGRVLLVKGRASGWPAAAFADTLASASIEGVASAHGFLGLNLVRAGDLDADYLADFMVLAPGNSQPRRLYVAYGSTTAWNGTISVADLPVLTGNGLSPRMAVPIDFNHDGFGDVAIASPDEYRFYLVRGRAQRLAGSQALEEIADMADDDLPAWHYATSISGGDVNGDGFDDLLVGYPGRSEEALGQANLVFGTSQGTLASTIRPRVEDPANVAAIPTFPYDGSFSLASETHWIGAAFSEAMNPATVTANSFRVYAAGPDGAAGTADDVQLTPAEVTYGGELAPALWKPSSPLAPGNYRAEVTSAMEDTDGNPVQHYSWNFRLLGNASLVREAPAAIIGANPSERLTGAQRAGDLNGDGIDDLILFSSGGPTADNSAPANQYPQRGGQLYIRFGSGGAWPAGTNARLMPVILKGDANSDQNPADARRYRACGIGDINGDGLADLAVGAPSAIVGGVRTGRLHLFFGRRTGWENLDNLGDADVIVDGDPAGGNLASTVAAAGDVNGDGLADVLVGDPLNSKAYLITGRRTGWAASMAIANVATRFIGESTVIQNLGSNLAGLGDVNGDGLDDFAITAPGWGDSRQGKCYVVFGSRSAWAAEIPIASVAGASFVGDKANGWGCDSLAGVGDVNGDHIADFAVSTTNEDVGDLPAAGRVHLIAGRTSGWTQEAHLLASAFTTIEGDHVREHAGVSVAGLGDTNGDGLADFAIGAYSESTDRDWPSTRSLSGRVGVFLGRPAGLPAHLTLDDADRTHFDESDSTATDRYGDASSVFALGDVNNDGHADYGIGAANTVHHFYTAGALYVYFGN